MRTSITAGWLLTLSFLALPGGPATAAPLPSHRVTAPAAMTQTVGHRVHYRAYHRHHAKHGYRHRKSRAGWLPPLPRNRHLPGKWSHKHCGDWHRCHYYFYGYRQWAMWNPDKSRAYFRRHYHH